MTPLECLEQVLRSEIKPISGCSEPVSIGLAACHASRLAGGEVERLDLKISPDIFRSAMEVGIPGTHGTRGVELAAALGCHSPVARPDLTVFSGIDEGWLARAQAMVLGRRVTLKIDEACNGPFIEVRARARGGAGRAVILEGQEQLALLERNGTVIHEAEARSDGQPAKVIDLRRRLAEVPFSELLEALPNLSGDLRQLMQDGIELNRKVAESGLSEGGILKIGQAYRTLIQKGWLANDVITRAKMLTTAAVDARISGCSLGVMTSAGSGNQGLTITLPLSVIATIRSIPGDRLGEALGLAHAINSVLRHHTRKLTTLCGCVVGAGTALAAGLTYLLGGGLSAITDAVNNMIGGINGIICDSPDVGCALRLATAVESAFQSAFMALHGVTLPVAQGLLGVTIEETLQNVGQIAIPGIPGQGSRELAGKNA